MTTIHGRVWLNLEQPATAIDVLVSVSVWPDLRWAARTDRSGRFEVEVPPFRATATTTMQVRAPRWDRAKTVRPGDALVLVLGDDDQMRMPPPMSGSGTPYRQPGDIPSVPSEWWPDGKNPGSAPQPPQPMPIPGSLPGTGPGGGVPSPPICGPFPPSFFCDPANRPYYVACHCTGKSGFALTMCEFSAGLAFDMARFQAIMSMQCSGVPTFPPLPGGSSGSAGQSGGAAGGAGSAGGSGGAAVAAPGQPCPSGMVPQPDWSGPPPVPCVAESVLQGCPACLPGNECVFDCLGWPKVKVNGKVMDKPELPQFGGAWKQQQDCCSLAMVANSYSNGASEVFLKPSTPHDCRTTPCKPPT